MAFEEEEEEEESSDDGRDVSSERSTSNRQDQHIMQYAAAPATPPGASSPPRLPWPGQPSPAVGQLAQKEEEEESSDDPDTVPAELPVFRPSPPHSRVHQETRKVTRLLSTVTTRPPAFSITISTRHNSNNSYSRPPHLPLHLARRCDPPRGKILIMNFPLTIGGGRDGVAYRRNYHRRRRSF